jgi:hypothetical protein
MERKEATSPALAQNHDDDKSMYCRREERVVLPHRESPAGLLVSGVEFEGFQTVQSQSELKNESWKVFLQIQGLDPKSGKLYGRMEAPNIPSMSREVITFWEGEIIDHVSHSFYTRKWDASIRCDLQHWSKFPAFSHFSSLLMKNKGRELARALANSRWIFLRIKELFFLKDASPGLSIAGFYYCCLDRKDGTITGYYYDTDSTPNQKLVLQPARKKNSK